MEFFRSLKINTSEACLHEALTLNKLDSLSNDIFLIGGHNEEAAEIGGIWGEFTLSRSKIKGGLRFALLECPNALAWTVTTDLPPNPDTVTIHLTINREQKDASFLEEVEEFLDDHASCLRQFLPCDVLETEA
ncbi:hypothetical protein [Gramella sp. KN1008]|uniref:hypothetical protein n=1 Tax=Gramella sp. KN1008 TaxID=2529298 RepID=UPI00103FA523|nr:hypothetical protein [Gramella sp. KN1008]TBW29991.1 hypothetical protein EZJ28_00890 [Gramella sp. KN1008]